MGRRNTGSNRSRAVKRERGDKRAVRLQMYGRLEAQRGGDYGVLIDREQSVKCLAQTCLTPGARNAQGTPSPITSPNVHSTRDQPDTSGPTTTLTGEGISPDQRVGIVSVIFVAHAPICESGAFKALLACQ